MRGYCCLPLIATELTHIAEHHTSYYHYHGHHLNPVDIGDLQDDGCHRGHNRDKILIYGDEFARKELHCGYIFRAKPVHVFR